MGPSDSKYRPLTTGHDAVLPSTSGPNSRGMVCELRLQALATTAITTAAHTGIIRRIRRMPYGRSNGPAVAGGQGVASARSGLFYPPSLPSLWVVSRESDVP
ncbi:hypothetical protein MASR1M101_09720 [Gemmatimonas sp.]